LKIVVAFVLASLISLASALPSFASPAPSPGDPAVAMVWDRADFPVVADQVSRTWLWGPEPFASLYESYQQAPGGLRLVQYYDKSRMEINNTLGDRDSDWFVTNGLLTKELATGQLQTGDSSYETRSPAEIPIAGDPDDTSAPTYATFGKLLTAVGERKGDVTEAIDRAGNVHQDASLAHRAAFAYFVPETGHNIPDVFWDFLNSEGVVYDQGCFEEGKLFSPTFFATGYPISEPYWTFVKVAGQSKLVLVQAFERRVLTYTPDNPDGWQVEMGNVGQHYYLWRYGSWDRGLQHGKVVQVDEGDTCEVEIDGKVSVVRLIGIDAPEVGDSGSYGDLARAEAQEIMQGKEVLLEKDVSDSNPALPLLRYVYVGGRFANDWLVRSGYAETANIAPDKRYAAGLQQAEKYAEADELGIWGPAAPSLLARADILIDADSGQVLAAHNPDLHLAQASTTKTMTALLVLKLANLDDVVTVVKDDLVGEATAGLVEGEQLTVRTLLYGLLLPSGNDAATALARHVGQSLPGPSWKDPVQRFVDLMNQTAADMGLRDTHFVKPHGLDEDGHYSSAFDMVAIARQALQNPLFCEIVSTQTWEGAGHSYTNLNDLLKRYPGCDGVKTGYTDNAGLCLIFSARRDGHHLVGMVLNSDKWYDDSEKLLDYGFARLASEEE
jgi:endonuclease YncB( thermonuclease family)